MNVEPYLFFNGRCEEAIAFYTRALGAQLVMSMRYRESPEPHPPGMLPPGWEDKIMHAGFMVGDTMVMASDGCEAQDQPVFKGFALVLNAASDAEARRLFDALAEGGRVEMPLDKTFFASSFGMVADRFGVSWWVMAGAAQADVTQPATGGSSPG